MCKAPIHSLFCSCKLVNYCTKTSAILMCRYNKSNLICSKENYSIVYPLQCQISLKNLYFYTSKYYIKIKSLFRMPLKLTYLCAIVSSFYVHCMLSAFTCNQCYKEYKTLMLELIIENACLILFSSIKQFYINNEFLFNFNILAGLWCWSYIKYNFCPGQHPRGIVTLA